MDQTNPVGLAVNRQPQMSGIRPIDRRVALTYQEYIESKYPTFESAYGKCKEAVEAMHEVFPELAIVCGYAITGDGDRAHWWLLDSDGTIVDPTRIQYCALFGYREWIPGGSTCVGKCMECGSEIWKEMQFLAGSREEFCSDDCADTFALSLNEDISSMQHEKLKRNSVNGDKHES